MIRLFFISFVATLLVMLGGIVAVHVWCGNDLPSLAKVRAVESAVRTEVYASDDRLIATLSREDRQLVPLAEIPPHLVDAILAIEDRNFHRHWGVDPVGLVRAGLNNVRNPGGPLQGGSTITQQLAWNLFLSHEQTIQRKLKELVLTLRLERSFSKEEILELYLNEIYFGEGAYGVGTASRRFFGKDPADLSVSEAAVIAGIPKHPARYSPYRHPENATQRRNVVLNAMLETGAISSEELAVASAESLRVTRGNRQGANSMMAPYFVEAIRQKLMEQFGSEITYEGGLKVYTTLDADLQRRGEEELEKQLQALETRNRYSYIEGENAGQRPDSLPRWATHRLQGAVVLLDPKSGAVRVLCGGRDFDESEFNRVLQAKRQPGSAFKPFVFAAAIEEDRRVTDVLLDAPIVRFFPNGDQWKPTNFSRTFKGLVTLRETLAYSINIPSVLLLEEIGVERTIETARRVGIESRLPRVLSLALGTGEVTLLELTAAYAPFANHGIYAEPYLIEKVEDKTGKVLYLHRPETRAALDEDVAFLVSDLLASVVEYGTGRSARAWGLEGDAAGKTGTTDDYTDAWFIGFNQTALSGVWVGFDQKVSIGRRMTGAACALPIWTQLMKAASLKKPPGPFQTPRNIVTARICTESGRAATPFCVDTVEEIFIEGTEPDLSCPIHETPRGGFLPESPDRDRGESTYDRRFE